MTAQLLGLAAVVAIGIAAAGYGWGLAALLRRRWRLPRDRFTLSWIQVVLGLGALGHLLAAAGLVHACTIGVARAVIGAGVALAVASFVAGWKKRHRVTGGRKDNWIARACRWGAVAAVLTLTPAASLPPLAYDVLEYHLEASRLFLDSGTLEGAPLNFFTRLPMETELLYAAGQALVKPSSEDDRAAKWLAVGWVVLFAWGCGVVARRLGAGAAGRWGAVAVGAALPLAGKVGLDAYSDGATAVFAQLLAFGFLGLLQARRVGQTRRRADWILAGIGAGLAASCKWGVVPHVAVPAAGLIVLAGFIGRDPLGGIRKAALVGAMAVAVFSPWLLRAAAVTGNPVFPWMATVFATENWSPEQERFLVSTHRPLRPWESRYWSKAWEGMTIAAPSFSIAVGGDEKVGNGSAESGNRGRREWWIPLGAVLGLIGGLARRRGRRFALGAAGLSLLAALAWATVDQSPDRFLLPAAGIFVPAAAAGTAGLARRFGHGGGYMRVFAYSCALGLAAMAVQGAARRVALHVSGGYFHAMTNPLVGEEARDQVLGRSVVTLQNRVAAAMLRDGGRLLVLYEARGMLFPLPHSLNTVFDRSVLLDSIGDADSPSAIDRALREKGFTNVVVNEFELDRLIRFYPPLELEEPIPARESLVKSPMDPHPLMDLYRPYVSDARYAPKAAAIRDWHVEVVKRARWRTAAPNGLAICVSPIPSVE